MLELKSVSLPLEYRKKWNVNSQNDFYHLYLDGNKISDTLYRVGGIGGQMKDGYMMLLKQVEAFYPKEILEMSKKAGYRSDPKHLENQSCILNHLGEEKVNFKQFESPYLSGGVIYSLDSKYYNIETGELYCHSSSSMKSKDYLFLDCAYEHDKSKRGVMKICKKTGEFEMFGE